MHRVALFLLLGCIFNKLSTRANPDSLLTTWENTNNPDSVRIDAFLDYIYEGSFRSNPDSAVILANQLHAYTQEVVNKKGTVEALNLLGYSYFRIGNIPKAIAAYEEGLALAEEINYKYGIARILERTGFIYHDNGDLTTALTYYQRSLSLFLDMDEQSGVRSIYNEFGGIFFSLGDLEKSLNYYQKALDIADKLNDENSKSGTLLNIGKVYIEKKQYSKALESLNAGLDQYEKVDDKSGIAYGLANIADAYSVQGDNEEALVYYNRSLAICEQINELQGISDVLLSATEIYIDQGEYGKAIKNCQRSLTLSIQLGDVDDQLRSCICLYKSYRARGNLIEALAYIEQVLALTDSLNKEDISRRMQQMEFSKQVLEDSIAAADKARQIEIAHQEEMFREEKTRNLSIAMGIIAIILAIGIYSRLVYIRKSKAILQLEKDRSENLLLNILPAEIAKELKEKGKADARDFDMVSILFTDFKGFTAASAKLNAQDLVSEINACFKAFDGIMVKYNIEKIKTIGDAYMAAGGIPVQSDNSTKNTVLAAQAMQVFISKRKTDMDKAGKPAFEMRVGVHTGPVVAGIVGVKKFQYDIWGDTVNTASRMESAGEVGRVNISQATYELLKDDPSFSFTPRGKVEVKGKGAMEMYFVSNMLGPA